MKEEGISFLVFLIDILIISANGSVELAMNNVPKHSQTLVSICR